MNAAIWPRVTKLSGQYLVFSGGLHPLVTPTDSEPVDVGLEDVVV